MKIKFRGRSWNLDLFAINFKFSVSKKAFEQKSKIQAKASKYLLADALM